LTRRVTAQSRDRALEAIRDWLTVRPDSEYDVLFTSLDHNTLGKPLSLTSIYPMVQRIGEKVGIKKIVSPHIVIPINFRTQG
jgi:site-specific recombinase XerC